PLPLHPSRLRERGFDQTALLAAPLAAALGVPLDTRRLRRIRPTPPQASLAEAQREANVRGAFEATRDETRRRVLLLDDVRTTGATLRSAAGALHRAGASQVRLMALAGVVEGRLPVARGSHL
ncbi:MAG TPA: phosphoribosyltransferase family protein, partial [Polyangiaceae bacterium LLY-WYZ-15_(1-7)]|nr:phosphoribosyltransferase family protein [Polyangiaceae bacterium LLY-WYZ-15_(1-7)]